MDRPQIIHNGFETLAKHIEIFPAIGNASQDLLRMQEDEAEDKAAVEQDETLAGGKTYLFETHPPESLTGFRPTPPLPRTEDHLFQYFIDGSVRGRSVGFGHEAARSFPLGFFQIGAGIVRRDTHGDLYPFAVHHRCIVTVQVGSQGISDTTWERLKAGMAPWEFLEIVPIRPKADTRAAAQDIRLDSNSAAFQRMHRIELDLCEAIRDQLHTSCRLIIDGSVKIGAFVNNPFVVGVAKSFWHMPNVSIEQQHERQRLQLMRILTMLPAGHRTPVYAAAGGSIGFWYVRLHPRREMHAPLHGVVKVEQPMPTRRPLDSADVDRISRAIVAEKSMSSYGLDKRWPSLIYPIHYAERIIKSGFLREDVLDHLLQRAVLR